MGVSIPPVIDPVYLDSNATTRIEPRVLSVLVEHLARVGNANSRTHVHGREANAAYQVALADVAALFDAAPHEVIPTSGATEAIDLAVLGSAPKSKRDGLTHVVTTAIEHGATLASIKALEAQGFAVSTVGCSRDGVVDAKAVVDSVRPSTAMVSVIHVNNETGAVQPVAEIAELLRDSDVIFHVDAAQSFGKLQTPLRHPRIDMVSFSGHKIHAPVGIGGLLVRDRVSSRISPRMCGASGFGLRRPGTPANALWIALATAARLAVDEAPSRIEAWLQHRGDAVETFERLGGRIQTPLQLGLPNVINVEFPGRDSEVVMATLETLVSISNGSACSRGSTPSHVLAAMGRSPREIQSATRWSWSHLTPSVPWQEIEDRLR